MKNKKLVKARLYSDRKHYVVVEVSEDEIEQVRMANRMIWKELKKEERQRIQLEKDGIVVASLESLDDDDAWITDSSLSFEEQMILEEEKSIQLEKLNVAIGKLEPRQQELIRLVYFENLSQDDVAKKLGITKSAVSHSFERIYASLKKILQEN